MKLETSRLFLEPIEESHADEMWELFSYSELHKFVPMEAPTIEQMRALCARWSKRGSPDGSEIWLNWAAREKSSSKVVAHLQVGIKTSEPEMATIGYVVGLAFQGKGLATEAVETIFDFLKRKYSISEVKAWTDTRNVASHRLAQKLGMVQVEFIKDADFFKGSTSDEFVFSKKLK